MEKDDAGIPKRIKNKFIRRLLLTCGFLFTFFAILGAILPLIPTTPFLIVAAACFYRSSERFYNLLMYNRYFGHYLRDYKSGRGIPPKVKIVSIIFLWISAMVSVFLFIPVLWLKILVITITTVATLHIIMIRSNKNS